jgi:hypothetical protein
MILAIGGGLVAGLLHVFAGPDHLAALAPMAVEDPARAARLGLLWGFGHGAGVVLLGGLGILARAAFDVEALSAGSERLVGVVLIGVGLWALRAAMAATVHSHPHGHHPAEQGHPHLHPPGSRHDEPGAHARHSHAVFGVGMLHGAAGTGHVLGVLPSLALPPAAAAGWLGAYLLGAVGAMGGFGLLLGAFAARQGARGLRGLLGGSGALAVAVGLFWILAGPV